MELRLNIDSVDMLSPMSEINIDKSKYYPFSDKDISTTHNLHKYLRQLYKSINLIDPKLIYINGQIIDNDLLNDTINIIIGIDKYLTYSYSFKFFLNKLQYVSYNYEYYNSIFSSFINEIKFENIKIFNILDINESNDPLTYSEVKSEHHIFIKDPTLEVNLSDESEKYLRYLGNLNAGLLVYGLYYNNIENPLTYYKIFVNIYPDREVLSFRFYDKDVNRTFLNLLSFDIINYINNLTK